MDAKTILLVFTTLGLGEMACGGGDGGAATPAGPISYVHRCPEGQTVPPLGQGQTPEPAFAATGTAPFETGTINFCAVRDVGDVSISERCLGAMNGELVRDEDGRVFLCQQNKFWTDLEVNLPDYDETAVYFGIARAKGLINYPTNRQDGSWKSESYWVSVRLSVSDSGGYRISCDSSAPGAGFRGFGSGARASSLDKGEALCLESGIALASLGPEATKESRSVWSVRYKFQDGSEYVMKLEPVDPEVGKSTWPPLPQSAAGARVATIRPNLLRS